MTEFYSKARSLKWIFLANLGIVTLITVGQHLPTVMVIAGFGSAVLTTLLYLAL